MGWGLQYSLLERPRTPLQRQRKRKADTDNGSRRVRAREDQGDDSATGSESTSSQDVNDQGSPQDVDDQGSPRDVDDQGSQPSRVISVQLQVPTNEERRNLVEWLMAAAEREDRRGHGRRVTPSNPPEDPYDGYVLGWRIDSPTTTKRRRNRMHHPDGRSIHTSELQGRHQDRSSRDRTPREEPRLPVSSLEPTRPFSREVAEELRRSVSSEET